MTNAFLLCILLYILFPCSTSAGPRSTAPLSQQLEAAVPSCAHGCLSSLIESFPTTTCHDPQSLQCLCTKQSRTGYTLGEGVLTCVASACSPATFQLHEDVYEICLGVEHAQSMTHKTLTASQVLTTVVTKTRNTSPLNQHHQSMASNEQTFPSDIPFSSSDITTDAGSEITTDSGFPTKATTTFSDFKTTTTDKPISSLDVTSLEATISTSALSSPVSLVSPTSSSSFIASEASATSISSSNAATPIPSHALSKGQVAGVALAGVVSASLAFGVLFFFLCFRERKFNKRDSGSSFGNDKEIDVKRDTLQSSSYTISNPGWATQSNSVEQTPQMQQYTLPTNRKSNRWSSIFRRSIRPEEIGVAIAPGPKTPLMHDPEPPMSAATYRTASQLLPEAPLYGLHPRERGADNEVSPISPVDPYVQFPSAAGLGFSELHGTSSRNLSQGPSELDATPRAPQTGFLPLRISTSDPILDARRARDSVFHPGEGQESSSAVWTRSMETLRKPVPAKVTTRNPLRSQRSRGSMQSRGIQRSASKTAPAGPPASSLATLPSQQRRAPTQTPEQAPPPSTSQREASLSRQSTASETEFEDTGSDDESPPLPEFPKPGTGSLADLGSQRFMNAAAMLQNSQVGPQPKPPVPRVPRQYIPPSLTPSLAPSLRGVTTTTITANPSDVAPPPLSRLSVTQAVSSPLNIAELPGSAVSGARRETVAIPTTPSTTPSRSPGLSPRNEGRDVRRSAKWKVLLGSGEVGTEGNRNERLGSAVQ